MTTKPTLPPSIWAENRPTLPPTTDSQWGQGFEYTSTTSGGKALTETFDYPLFKIDESLRWLRDLFDDNGVISSLPDATTSQKGVVEKATTAEAEAATSDKYPDSAGVHAAFNQYGFGGYAKPLTSSDDLFAQVAGSIVEWLNGKAPSNAPTNNASFAFIGAGNGTVYIVLDRYTGHKWTYTSAGSGGSGWRRDVTLEDKATTAQAKAGTDDEAYMTASTTADVTLGSRKQSIKDYTTSRQSGVFYPNNSGAPILVSVGTSNSEQSGMRLTVKDRSGVNHVVAATTNISGPDGSVCYVVPDGYEYQISGVKIEDYEFWTELSL